MNEDNFTVEFFLDELVNSPKYLIDKKDYRLLSSINTQVSNNIGLTDRQFELLQSKLEEYKSQFLKNGLINLDFSKSRLPIRSIDRSRWIRLTDENTQIAVRFIFNKKLISEIEKVKHNCGKSKYDADNKIHYFPFSEKNIYNIVNILKDKNFEIQDEILNICNKLDYMIDNKENYIPGIYNFKFKNLKLELEQKLLADIGQPDLNNLAIYKDRQHSYGLHHFDQADLNASIFKFNTLSKKIINRKTTNIFIDKNTYNLNQVVESLLELDRFPILILLNGRMDAIDILVETHTSFKNIIPNEEISVLFRQDNDATGTTYNEYIKQNNLNNSVDENTKIVYIEQNKIPKPLIMKNWRFKTALLNSTVISSKTMTYLYDKSDLIINYDISTMWNSWNNSEKI